LVIFGASLLVVAGTVIIEALQIRVLGFGVDRAGG